MNHTMILNTMTNVKVLSLGEDLGEVLGDAVYTARVMLNLDPTDLNMEYAKPPVHNQPIITENTVKVYPNPANDRLYIALDGAIDGIANVDFYDLSGKLIYNTTINAVEKLQTSVNVSQTANFISIESKDSLNLNVTPSAYKASCKNYILQQISKYLTLR